MKPFRDSHEQSSLIVVGERRLTAAEFQGLAEVPAAAEWFANLDNPRTRRAYQGDIGEPAEFGKNRTLRFHKALDTVD